MDSLGDRMKGFYESVFKHKLPYRMPVIIRLDGKAFHTFTRKLNKPFDEGLISWMNHTAIELCRQIQGAQIAYVQSDEISILLHNYKKFNSGAWFDNEIQKMCSISAAIATAAFNSTLRAQVVGPALFDSRVFVLPEHEVCNYYIWRQQDWIRNSIQMVARSFYSDKECFKKNQSEMQEMIFQKGVNWDDFPVPLKRGRCVIKDAECKWIVDDNIPIFTQDRDYINKHLFTEES